MTTYNTPTAVRPQPTYVYGYDFPVNPSKTVAYLQISNDVNIKILAI